MMQKQDTIELLKECVSGAEMCISALNEMLDKTHNADLKKSMEQCKREHLELYNQASNILYECGEHGKKPSPIAKGMSYLKTNVTLTLDPSDHSVSKLAAKGCDMGIRTLSEDLKTYAQAEPEAKEIAVAMIEAERALAKQTELFI